VECSAATRKIPRPAGESAGPRDDAQGLEFKLTTTPGSGQTHRRLSNGYLTVAVCPKYNRLREWESLPTERLSRPTRAQRQSRCAPMVTP
jgi:hypothetical protein